MTFIVATNVIASRPPERRPTGTPHARAKKGRTHKHTNLVTWSLLELLIAAKNVRRKKTLFSAKGGYPFVENSTKIFNLIFEHFP